MCSDEVPKQVGDAAHGGEEEEENPTPTRKIRRGHNFISGGYYPGYTRRPRIISSLANF